MDEHYTEEDLRQREQIKASPITALESPVITILKYIFFPFIIGTIITTFFFQMSEVEGTSMYPTYKEGNYVFIKKCANTYHYGDVVIAHTDVDVIKRLVGMPGDTIEIKDSNLYLNGTIVQFHDYSGIESKGKTKFVLGENQYFIVGDNFNVSYDSRYYGPISKDQLIGKTLN